MSGGFACWCRGGMLQLYVHGMLLGIPEVHNISASHRLRFGPRGCPDQTSLLNVPSSDFLFRHRRKRPFLLTFVLTMLVFGRRVTEPVTSAVLRLLRPSIQAVRQCQKLALTRFAVKTTNKLSVALVKLLAQVELDIIRCALQGNSNEACQ